MLAASFARLKENKNNGKGRYYWHDLKKSGEINIHAEKRAPAKENANLK